MFLFATISAGTAVMEWTTGRGWRTARTSESLSRKAMIPFQRPSTGARAEEDQVNMRARDGAWTIRVTTINNVIAGTFQTDDATRESTIRSLKSGVALASMVFRRRPLVCAIRFRHFFCFFFCFLFFFVICFLDFFWLFYSSLFLS